MTWLEAWPLILAATASDNGVRPVGALRGRLSHLAGSMSSLVLEEVDLDAVLGNVDVNALFERIDVNALLGRIDVNALLGRMDVDALLGRMDVDALLGRMDVDALLGRMDVNALLGRMDVDALMERVDANVLLARLDLDEVMGRIDLQRVFDRVDIDAVLARVDVDAVVNRIDLEHLLEKVDLQGLVRRAGIPDLVADSTGQLAGSALDLGRRQLVGIDIALHRALTRLLRRDPAALPDGPPTLVDVGDHMDAAPDPESPRVKARAHVSGFYAGPVTRLLAFCGDVFLATGLFTLGTAGLAWVLDTMLGVTLPRADQRPWWSVAALAAWLFVYWGVSSALAGRTPVMMLTGLRIVARDGSPLRPRSALFRTLTLPFSLLFFGAGGAWMLLDRERRALHDLLGGSAVVYDWGGRAAQMPTPLARWIETHGGGGASSPGPPATNVPPPANPPTEQFIRTR